jgi:hypothetical protein
MRARTGCLALLGACLALGGCISSQGRLYITSFAPGAEDAVGLDSFVPPVRREVVGRDTRITSVLLVPTFDGPRFEQALADALAAGGGEALHSVRARTIEFWFLVGWSVLEVRGDVAAPGSGDLP